jgi:hypothetical protein
MEIQKQLGDFEREQLPMPFLKECFAEVELKENLIVGFRAGEISANEMFEIWKEDSIKINGVATRMLR